MYYVFIDELLLPTPPTRIKTKINNQNKTVRLANEGEINLLTRAGLTDVSFDMRVFHQENPYTRDLRPVEDYLSKLEILKQSKKPFQFIVVRSWDNGKTLYDTNLKVSLEDYEIDENASDGNMTVIDVNLKQSRDYDDIGATLEERVVDGETILMLIKENDRYSDKVVPATVTARAGDTLWDICRRELGDGTRYISIANLNNLANPNGVFTGGEVIRLE